MPVYIVEKCLKVQLNYTIAGNRNTCNMYYGTDDTPTTNVCQLLAAEWRDEVLPAWQACVSDEVRFQMLYVTGVVANTFRPGRILFSDDFGGVSSHSLPSNIPAIIQLRQSETPSRHNGRLFVSGVPESMVENSLITGAAITTEYEALAVALATPLTLTGPVVYNLAIAQRSDAGVPTDPPAMIKVEQVVPKRALANQKRRTVEWAGFMP